MFAATVVFFRNRSEDFPAQAFPQRIRSRPHFPAEGYRPHFAPKGSRDMLGIVFAAFEHTRFGEPLQAGLDYLYPGRVDYSALRPGTEFWIMEGGTAVGEGVITHNDSPPAVQAT